MSDERRGEAYELDEQLTVVGKKLRPGDAAPDFALVWLDPEAASPREVRLAESAGTVRVLSVMNSIDTPTCQIQTRRWDELKAGLPSDVTVYSISMDLPYATARWQAAEGVTHPALSAHRSEQFGADYGVLIKEWRLLQRAMIVIDRDDRVRYAEYVADQAAEPDYDAAIEAVRQAAD